MPARFWAALTSGPGRRNPIATDMVNALNTAVSANADGIAVCLVDETAFNDPVEKALKAAIPVVSYNADAKGNKRRYAI